MVLDGLPRDRHHSFSHFCWECASPPTHSGPQDHRGDSVFWDRSELCKGWPVPHVPCLGLAAPGRKLAHILLWRGAGICHLSPWFGGGFLGAFYFWNKIQCLGKIWPA